MSVAKYCVVALLLSGSLAHAETGLASYYHGVGKDGEMTCAHHTKPFGSMLRVSNRNNTVECRVNDRGPFIRGRIIDVSTGVARALGIIEVGVVEVRVE